jgi:hypothetical protein
MSVYFNKAQLRALERLGNLMLPRSGDYPSFAELGCLAHIDEIAAWIPDSDRADLGLLLNLLALMPDFGLRGLIQLVQNPDRWPEGLAAVLRQIDTGLRGIIMSLYYSGRKGPAWTGPTPLELMGVEIVRVPLES